MLRIGNFSEVMRMANESCDPTPAAASEPVKPGTRMVHCVKFDKELPGLDRIPWAGELGKRVFVHCGNCGPVI